MMNRFTALVVATAVALTARPAHGHSGLVNITLDLGGAVPVGSSGLKETTFRQYPFWADACNPAADPAYDAPDMSPGPGYQGSVAICNPASGGFNWGLTLDFGLPPPARILGFGLGYDMTIFARIADPLYTPAEGGGENKGDSSPYISHYIFAIVPKLRFLDAGKNPQRKRGSLDLELRWGYGGLYGTEPFFQMSQVLTYMFAPTEVFQIGLFLAFNEGLALKKRKVNGYIPWGPTSDARSGQIAIIEGDKNEFWLSFGARMAFGFGGKGKREKKVVEDFGQGESDYAEQMKIMDSDGDGLSNYAEMMLGTDSTNKDSDGDTLQDGVEDANRNGARDAGETNPSMPDTDVGGVNDGWEVANGYDPFNPDDDDRDLDGVMDDVDACPGTPPGSEVGTSGCPTLTESVVLDQVTFVEGTSELNPEAYSQLDQYAMILMQDPGLEIVILVFGPPGGKAKKVKQETEDQAVAIRDYLVMRGVDEARITVSGEGKAPDGPKVELQPIIPMF